MFWSSWRKPKKIELPKIEHRAIAVHEVFKQLGRAMENREFENRIRAAIPGAPWLNDVCAKAYLFGTMIGVEWKELAVEDISETAKAAGG